MEAKQKADSEASEKQGWEGEDREGERQDPKHFQVIRLLPWLLAFCAKVNRTRKGKTE